MQLRAEHDPPVPLAVPRVPPSKVHNPASRGKRSEATRARRRQRMQALANQHLAMPLCQGPASEYAAILSGLARLHFFPASGVLDFSQPGALELFGCGVAKALTRQGAPWVLVFELNTGPDHDLDSPEVRRLLWKLISSKAFASFGAAPVCTSFSTAIRPPWRSTALPQGLPGLSAAAFAKVKTSNDKNQWLALSTGKSRLGTFS